MTPNSIEPVFPTNHEQICRLAFVSTRSLARAQQSTVFPFASPRPSSSPHFLRLNLATATPLSHSPACPTNLPRSSIYPQPSPTIRRLHIHTRQDPSEMNGTDAWGPRVLESSEVMGILPSPLPNIDVSRDEFLHLHTSNKGRVLDTAGVLSMGRVRYR